MLAHGGKTYPLGPKGFLADRTRWDDDFAEGMAPLLGIEKGLTKEHWDVITYIRDTFERTGRCPIIYETCRMNGLNRRTLKKLFPTGYQRGACIIAGITSRDSRLGTDYMDYPTEDLHMLASRKTYQVDAQGYLIDADDWDEVYAGWKAHDMKIPGGKLGDRHWRIIRFLRRQYQERGEVPTVYETCEAMEIELDDLEQLFPDGYHRGAVKIAGLRVA